MSIHKQSDLRSDRNKYCSPQSLRSSEAAAYQKCKTKIKQLIYNSTNNTLSQLSLDCFLCPRLLFFYFFLLLLSSSSHAIFSFAWEHSNKVEIPLHVWCQLATTNSQLTADGYTSTANLVKFKLQQLGR